jgi:hypothetical protein
MAHETPADRWDELNNCPDCGRGMQRDAAVGERLGLFYICPDHGRFRYSWDEDRLESYDNGRNDVNARQRASTRANAANTIDPLR